MFGLQGRKLTIESSLKKLRQSLGLTIAQAAKQVEVGHRTWARWESGDQAIPAGYLRLFKLLNHVERVPRKRK